MDHSHWFDVRIILILKCIQIIAGLKITVMKWPLTNRGLKGIIVTSHSMWHQTKKNINT